jgi:hypothetical protein
VISASGGAVAATLIGGAQIRDGSISARDLNAAVRKQLARTGARGPAGPVGAPGAAGVPGAPGVAGSPDGPAQVRDKLLEADGPGSALDADTVDGLQGADLEAAGADRTLTLPGSAWLPANPATAISSRGAAMGVLSASGTVSGQLLATLPLPLPARIGDRRLRIRQISVCNSKLTDGAATAVTGSGFRLDAGNESGVGGGQSLAPAADIFLACPSTTLSDTGTLVDDGSFSSIGLYGSTTASTAQVLRTVTVRYRYAPAP